jgi:hypothetical protein
MPVPDQDAIGVIYESVRANIVNDIRPPTAALTLDQRRMLVDLCRDDATAFDDMRERLQAVARAANWSEAAIRDHLRFRNVEMQVANQRRAEIETDRSIRTIRAANLRATNARTSRTPPPPDAPGVLTPQQMIESDSPRLMAIGHLLTKRAGRLWHDAFYKREFTDWCGDANEMDIGAQPVTDAWQQRVVSWLHQIDARLGRIGTRNLLEAIEHVCHQDVRNAPRDWLFAQTWDRTERLEGMLIDAFGADDTQFNRDVARCWFVSMVARIVQPGCKVDTMPVLYGGQGAFKSQALEIIGGDFYRASHSSVDSTNFLQELHGVMCLEIPEMHSIVASKHGAAKIKAVLSIRMDHFRLPYGRKVEDHLRTAVMVGTTNERNWHMDTTGGRRFWPVKVTSINLDWLQANRAQLFAEALAMYQAGREWWDVDVDAQAALMEAERAVDPWEEVIAHNLNDPTLHDGTALGAAPVQGNGGWGDGADWGTLVTINRVGSLWLRLSMDQLGKGGVGNRIGAILRRLGWRQEHRRIAGRGSDGDGQLRVRYWIRDSVTEYAPSEFFGYPSQVVTDDDIPF